MESDCARAIRFYNWAVLYMATATLEAIARRVREEREAPANGDGGEVGTVTHTEEGGREHC